MLDSQRALRQPMLLWKVSPYRTSIVPKKSAMAQSVGGLGSLAVSSSRRRLKEPSVSSLVFAKCLP